MTYPYVTDHVTYRAIFSAAGTRKRMTS